MHAIHLPDEFDCQKLVQYTCFSSSWDLRRDFWEVHVDEVLRIAIQGHALFHLFLCFLIIGLPTLAQDLRFGSMRSLAKAIRKEYTPHDIESTYLCSRTLNFLVCSTHDSRSCKMQTDVASLVRSMVVSGMSLPTQSHSQRPGTMSMFLFIPSCSAQMLPMVVRTCLCTLSLWFQGAQQMMCVQSPAAGIRLHCFLSFSMGQLKTLVGPLMVHSSVAAEG
jgi:hypothetical protein